MDLVKIGKYIAAKRKEKGMTQKQLAEKLGMSDKSVSKWERGICLPDVSVYTDLCHYGCCSYRNGIADKNAGECDRSGRQRQCRDENSRAACRCRWCIYV